MKLERRAELVVRDDDADRTAARDKRNVQRGSDAHPASDLLIDLGIVEHGVDSLAPSALEDAARLRAAELELHPDEAVCVGAFAVGCRDAETLAPRLGQSDEHEPRVDEAPQPACDEAEQRLELELAGERVPISFSDSRWRSHRVDVS